MTQSTTPMNEEVREALDRVEKANRILNQEPCVIEDAWPVQYVKDTDRLTQAIRSYAQRVEELEAGVKQALQQNDGLQDLVVGLTAQRDALAEACKRVLAFTSMMKDASPLGAEMRALQSALNTLTKENGA